MLRTSSLRTPGCGGLRAALILGALVWGAAGPAAAQIETLVTINTLTPAQAGGCYPGTSGSDATMFIRLYPGSTGCGIGNPFDDLCLVRKEFAGDGVQGLDITLGSMDLFRPSLYGDGSVVWFVNDLDLCVMLSNGFQSEACYNFPNPPNATFIHYAASNPQGNEVAFIPRDPNNISIPDNSIEFHAIGTFPSLPFLAQALFTAPFLRPDSVDYMARGGFLVFDASDILGQFGLYLINRTTGVVSTLAAPVAGYQLRNPQFGQTTDDVIVFEAVEIATGGSTILTANLLTGAVTKIAEVAVNPSVPTYNGDDTKILFHREDPGVNSTISLRERTVLGDWQTPFGAEVSHITDGGFGTVYRRGTFDDSAIPCPEPGTALGLGAGVGLLGLLSRRRG